MGERRMIFVVVILYALTLGFGIGALYQTVTHPYDDVMKGATLQVGLEIRNAIRCNRCHKYGPVWIRYTNLKITPVSYLEGVVTIDDGR